MNKVNKLDYGFYSRLLNEPFDTVEALVAAEEAYKAKQKAKEDKAAAKKADAKKVEEAFKNLNLARKTYKADLNEATDVYREALTTLKSTFEETANRVRANLAAAEDAYKAALKEFADKYPEGYHLTLKDGDFETTISSNHNIKKITRDNDFWDRIHFFNF